MRFPNAAKYVAGFAREVEKGKRYRLTLQYKDGDKWVKKPSKTVHCGKRQADKLLIEFQEEQEELAAKAPAADTASVLTIEIAIVEYLDLQLNTFHTLEKSTYSKQMALAEKRIFPYIGRIPIDKFYVEDIENFWTRLSNEGCGQTYIRAILAVVKKVLEYHYKQGSIPFNPFRKMKEFPERGNPKVCHMSPEMFEQLDGAILYYKWENRRMETAMYLAMYGGLRRGEICGLKWQDVDLVTNTLSITNAIGVTKGGTYTKKPKNKSSNRKFPMMPQLLERLQLEYVIQEREYKHIEGGWYVCGNRFDYMNPNTLSMEAKNFFEECGITDTEGRRMTLHGLRHNFATIGVLSHVDVKSLQNMLGHASASMTLDTYADMDDTAMRISAGKMSDYLQEKANLELVYPEDSRKQIDSVLKLANAGDITIEQLVRAIELVKNGAISV